MSSRYLGHRKLAAVTAAALLAAGHGACSSSSSTGTSSSTSASSSATLIMESSPESTITQEFNPFVPTAGQQGMGATGLIYEPLLQFDIAAPPKYYPWLATSYQWSNGGKSVTFTIRQGVKWNNGTPMTPADVAFTYNLVKNNKALNLAGLAISSVSTSGNTVTLTFPAAQYTNLQSIAGVPILPQSIWGKVGNPTTFTDANPVGTGPYVLKTFTPQGFTLTKNTGYWQASLVKVPERLLPGLHLQHRRAVGAVLRPDRLDRQLHPRPAEAVRRHRTRLSPLLGGTGQHQRPDAEPEQVADQPAGRAARRSAWRSTARCSPPRARRAWRTRYSTPAASRCRPSPPGRHRLARTPSPPPATRPRRRTVLTKAAGYTKGSNGYFAEGREDRHDHADQPVRLHRLRGGRHDRRAGAQGRPASTPASRASAWTPGTRTWPPATSRSPSTGRTTA